MKAAAISYLNDIVSLTVLALMAVALIDGQVDAASHAAEMSAEHAYHAVIEVRHQ